MYRTQMNAVTDTVTTLSNLNRAIGSAPGPNHRGKILVNVSLQTAKATTRTPSKGSHCNCRLNPPIINPPFVASNP